MRRNMTEYRVTLQDMTEHLAVRLDSTYAAADYESEENPIVQIQRTRTLLDVSVPDAPVQAYFQTHVTPQAAADGGCKAAPTAFTVANGTPVLFEALPAAGFVFAGWFVNAPLQPLPEGQTFDPSVPVATDALSLIAVTAPAPGATRQIEARFAPV